eukprot:38771-Hanusia_phi.AAC.6
MEEEPDPGASLTDGRHKHGRDGGERGEKCVGTKAWVEILEELNKTALFTGGDSAEKNVFAKKLHNFIEKMQETLEEEEEGDNDDEDGDDDEGGDDDHGRDDNDNKDYGVDDGDDGQKVAMFIDMLMESNKI